jgi:long-chain fatty acid transport protein
MKAYLNNKSLILCYAILFIGLLLAPYKADASNGIQTISSGPIQIGLGGAGVAKPMDTNAIRNNPAGLGAVANQADLSFNVAFTHSRMGSALAPAGNPNAVSVNGDEDPAFLPQASLATHVLSDKFTLGLGAIPTAGFRVDFPISRLNPAITNNLYDRSGEYVNYKVIPSAAYQIMDNLSIGVGLDINVALFHTDSGTLALGAPETFGLSHTDQALGIGARIGLTYAPIDMLQIGAMYVTPQFFNTFGRYLDLIPGGLNLPQEVQFGLAVMPFKGATLLTDFKWMDWSSGFMGSSLAQGGLHWRDQFVFACGFQYDFDPHFGFPLILRTGYNFGRSPITPENAFRNLLIPAVIQHHVTAGLGMEVSDHIALNGYYVHEFRNTVTDNGTGQVIGTGSFISNQADAFGVGVTGSWGKASSKKTE